MEVTKYKFQLEADFFKLGNLLNSGLLQWVTVKLIFEIEFSWNRKTCRHEASIQKIYQVASKELELELKIKLIEERWRESALKFKYYKRNYFLVEKSCNFIIQKLEEDLTTLATVLTSKYIG